MRPYLRYQLPADANVTSLTVEEAPRTLALVKSGNECLLLHKVYAGRDGAGRPGNYFVHLLAGLEPTFGPDRAICFWRYQDALLWRTSDDPGHGVMLPPIPREELERRLRKRWERAWRPEAVPRGPDFFQLSESERSAALEFLPLLLLAFFDQQQHSDSLQAQREAEKTSSQIRRGGREVLAGESQSEADIPLICLVATPDQAAWLVWALARLLPPVLRPRLTFSTYEESGDLSSSRLIRRTFALVATCPAQPQHAATFVSERFYRGALAFNLFTGLHSSPREWPEVRDFVELACAAFRGGDLSFIEQLHRDLEGGASTIDGFLREYQRWRSNQGRLGLEQVVEIISRYPEDFSQLMVRRHILERLCDDQQGEALLDRVLPDLSQLARLRLEQRRLDHSLVLFENEVRRQWQEARLSAAARVRLLLTLASLGAGRELLKEAIRALLDDPAVYPVLLARPDRCSKLLSFAASALTSREAEHYREEVGRLLQGYRSWESCRSLLSLDLPPAWREMRLRLLLSVLEKLLRPTDGAPLPLEERDWQRLLQLLDQAQDAGSRAVALRLAALLLRDQAAPAFDLLIRCCQLSPPPTENEMEELLAGSALLRELSDLERGRVAASYRRELLHRYSRQLRYYAPVYLQMRLPALEELCLRLFTLLCLTSTAAEMEELLSLFFAQASNSLRERLLLVWPATETRAVASLIRAGAQQGDLFFLRTRPGVFFYRKAVASLPFDEKLQLLEAWLRQQPDPLDLHVLLTCSALTPEEGAWLLEQYGPIYLARPDYARCWELTHLTHRYLLSLTPERLRQPETRSLLKTLVAPKAALPDSLILLAWSWLRVAEALEQRQTRPELEKALDYLRQALDDQHYAALSKEIANKLKLKHLKPGQKKPQGKQYALEELKPEGFPGQDARPRGLPWLGWRLPWLGRRGLRPRR
uniref:Uncharacterized protein n=1 Tax=Thermogemmatispora argillosa TaxID=2045280 RepID=A0A455T1A5_9CHLR|nr:hypothetical protein KTA_13400 [Thermogemmatispora argillosa]